MTATMDKRTSFIDSQFDEINTTPPVIIKKTKNNTPAIATIQPNNFNSPCPALLINNTPIAIIIKSIYNMLFFNFNN